jgi:molecular chaperone GrpE
VTADIGEDVIQEALRSVEAHEREDAAAPEEAVAGEPTDSGPSPEVEELRAQLELSQVKGRELMEKLRDTHERMLRAAADLDNFKKRAFKEREEAQRFGIERVLKDLLPVLDNLDRALEHSDRPAEKGAAEAEALLAGVRMTRKLFEDALTRNGVKGFSSQGLPFDPHLHEAMQQVESAEVPPNTVMQEILRGYTLNDRLVRPALVVVSRAPAAAPEGAPPAEGAQS